MDLGLPWSSSGSDSLLPLQGGTGLIPGWGTKIPRSSAAKKKGKKQMKMDQSAS